MTTGDEMSKHTAGPLTVKVNEKWPYNIETFNAAGEVVFSASLPCHGTGQKNVKEAMAGVGMPADWNADKHNARALADEVLRAASPDLLDALNDFVLWFEDGETGPGFLDAARAAIDKAQGAA